MLAIMPVNVFVSLLLAAVICAGCATHTRSKGDSAWQGFRVLPPIPDADSSIRNEVIIKVPTKLAVMRTTDTLSIAVDRGSFDTTRITVGSKLVTGVQNELFVYSEGDARPFEGRRNGLSGVDFNLGTSILNAKQEGIPVPGKKYVVEMDMAIFETDIPPQHMWSPHSKNYRILWKRTLKQTVE